MKFLDLFAGIGGFRLGLEQVGHTCVGFVEIDKFARKSYEAIFDTKGEYTEHDINKINTKELPKADIWCFGFPCQDISVAGKQKGFEGNRSSLFFAVTRKLHELEDKKKPSYLLIENVKNLLSINSGWDFASLQIELDSLGYDIEWDILNSKEVVPQNRERVFIIGHFRGRCTRKVFPITRKGEPTSDEQKINIVGTTKPASSTRIGQRDVVYDPNGLMGTLGASDYKQPKQIAVRQVGNISNSDSFGGNPQVGRVYSIHGLSPALNTMQGGGREPKIILDDKGDFIKHGTKILSKLWERTKTENYAEWSERVSKLVSTTEILRQIMYEQLLSQDSSEIRKCELVCSPQESQRSRYGYSLQDLWSNQEYRHPSYRRKYSEQFTREFNCFVQKLPHEATQKKAYMQNLWKTSKRAPSLQQALHQMEKIRGSLVSQNQSKWRIRKLTPRETWRLQGFPDWAFDRAEKVNSNSQLYKQAGNSVTVPVIYEIAKRMNWEEIENDR